jgi:hypothetical protein
MNFNVKYFQTSIQEQIITRPPVDFDNPSRFTTHDYHVLTGLSLEQFNDLCNYIPKSSLYNTSNRTSRMAIGALLMKLRLALSHETLAVLLGLSDRKTVSNVLQSARDAIMKHFVPQHLGFEHISRRTLIDQRTRPLAKILLADNHNDKAILVLDSTYIYVQKSNNNKLQRKSYSMHKKRSLVKMMMVVSTNGEHRIAFFLKLIEYLGLLIKNLHFFISL